MKPAEVALIVDRQSFQEISLLHDDGRNLQCLNADLWLGVRCAARDGRASLQASSPRQLPYPVLLANKTVPFIHKLWFPFYILVSVKDNETTLLKKT